MRRAFLVLAAVPVLAVGAAVLGADAALQAPAVRTRLASAVERATGHATNLADGAALSVSGLWTLRPTVGARNVVVSNPPGFPAPHLATVPLLSARLALLPLLAGRVEVEDVVLDGADIRLQRDAAGRGNWERPAVVPSGPGISAPGGRRETRIGHVSVTNTRVSWPGIPVLSVGRLDAEPAGGPVSAAFALGDAAFTLSGTAGPVVPSGTAESGAASGTAGPGAFDLVLSGAGARLSLVRGAGVRGAGVHGAGDAVAVRGEVADLSALSPVFGRSLPPLRAVTVEAEVAPAGLASFRLSAGSTPFGPDLVLERLDVAASSPDAPVQAQASARLRGLPVAATLAFPALAALRSPGRLPAKATVQADGGTLAAEGSVADVSGGDPQFTVSARIPDLRRAGLLAGHVLPALHDLALDARLAPAPGGGVAVRGLRATAAEGDVGGDLAVRLSPRPALRGSLVFQRVDLDAALPALPDGSVPVGPAAALSAPAAAAPPPAPPPSVSLPFAVLRTVDADLRATAASVQWHGVAFRNAMLRVLLQDGRLRVDPAEALTPGGSVQARLAADATATPPTVAVALLAPGLDAAALVAALGRPGATAGTADLDIDLRAAGADLPAMLPTLDGHAGVAVVNGEIDNGLLLLLFGPVLRTANLSLDGAGRTALRCFATRADAAAGQVALRTLALDSSRLRLEGEGAVNLVAGTLDLHLRPTVRLGGAGVAVPVRLTGPWRTPTPSLERGAIAPGRVGLSILLGGGAPASDPCGPALAAARGNRPGQAPQ